ncbi:MAG TPA: serine kinase [Thermohalobaculum sp.]|nr:serine kinase [Thermohalobaculum sp.]
MTSGDPGLHASAVAVGGRGLLITGAPGAGKTTLALEMVALGAALIADDLVLVERRAETGGTARLWVAAPPNAGGLVEIRGFGLVRLAATGGAPLALVADLDQAETERLPPVRQRVLSGIACRAILCKGKPGLAAALTCMLRAEDWPGADLFAGQ